MVAKLKEKGIREIGTLKRRTLQLFALGRIDKKDSDFIVNKLSEVEQHIHTMDEKSGDANG